MKENIRDKTIKEILNIIKVLIKDNATYNEQEVYDVIVESTKGK